MTSQKTKRYKRLAFLMGLCSFLMLICPIGYFTVNAFIAGQVIEKVSLGALATVAVIMVAMNALLKLHLRSPLWLLLIGIYIAVDYIMPVLIFVAIGTILDEIVFTPLRKRFNNKAIINAELDKRLP